MICERCGTVFCWDEADMSIFSGNRKRFCGDACKKKKPKPGIRSRQAARDAELLASQAQKKAAHEAGRRWRRLMACVEKDKLRYRDEGAAILAASKYELQFGARRYPYECPCGDWHLTSEPPEARKMADALKGVLFGDSANKGDTQ